MQSRPTAHFRRGEGVELGIVDRVDRNELALEMGGELGDLDARLGADPLHLVAIGLRRGGLLEVEQAAVPSRDLDALVAVTGGPLGHRLQRIIGRGVAGELGEQDARALHGLHCNSPPRLFRLAG
jgi:hypothetical protein